MLINFRFQNCRSFLDDTSLSLQATFDHELEELNTFQVDSKLMPKDENTVLKSALIFGNNASGKSNVLKALAYMRNVIFLSASQVPIAMKNEPFAFKEDSETSTSLYEVEFIENNSYYKYGFSLSQGVVKEEWLYRRSDRRLTSVFERKEDSLTISGLKEKQAGLINLTKQTLFLSIANNFHLEINPYLNDVINWFRKLLIVFDNNANSLDIYTTENGKYKAQALEILKKVYRYQRYDRHQRQGGQGC